jgi:hypothetical protein
MNETETYKLPISGKDIIIRGYVTGAIDREVRKLAAAANKMSFSVDASKIDGVDQIDTNAFPPGTMANFDIDPTAQISADDKLVELRVSALDGSTADVFNRLMQLPKEDVEFVTDKIKALQAVSQVAGADPKAPTN